MYLTADPIDIASLLADVPPSDGGVCLFLGTVRNTNPNQECETTAIEYEAYGPMAEAEMARIVEGLAAEWPQVRIRMRHRVGLLTVGQVSVAIVATAPHRVQAFAACRAAIDRIKTRVPIWKKEFHPDGSSDWVDPTEGGRT